MAAVMIRRAACRTLALGARGESTMAAVAVNAVDSSTDADAVLQQIGPVADEVQLARLTAAVALPASSEQAARERQLELYRLHNSSLNLHGQIIRARVIDMDRKKILIDTGLKIAKIAHSDITDECIIGTTNPEDDDEPRRPGEVRIGDVVQVFLESMETPEGDMLVSGQQAAQERRFHVLWRDLAAHMESRQAVKGRILNQLTGGYAVGVAGLVCFLPANACHPRTAANIGQLQDFYITGMNAERRNVVLRDTQFSRLMARQARLGAADPRGAVRKPRGAENPEQISKTVSELQELLGGGKPAAGQPAGSGGGS